MVAPVIGAALAGLRIAGPWLLRTAGPMAAKALPWLSRTAAPMLGRAASWAGKNPIKATVAGWGLSELLGSDEKAAPQGGMPAFFGSMQGGEAAEQEGGLGIGSLLAGAGGAAATGFGLSNLGGENGIMSALGNPTAEGGFLSGFSNLFSAENMGGIVNGFNMVGDDLAKGNWKSALTVGGMGLFGNLLGGAIGNMFGPDTGRLFALLGTFAAVAFGLNMVGKSNGAPAPDASAKEDKKPGEEPKAEADAAQPGQSAAAEAPSDQAPKGTEGPEAAEGPGAAAPTSEPTPTVPKGPPPALASTHRHALSPG